MLRRIALAAVLVALGCAGRAPQRAPGVATAAVTPAADCTATNPHDQGGKPLCQRCHEPGASGVKQDPIALCAGCHDPARMRHPFRVPVSEQVEGLPLLPGRLIACHTCHDPHDVKARRAGLRMKFAELCLRCHDRHAPSAQPAGPPSR